MSEIEELEKRAKDGDAEAMYKLGAAYAFGIGVCYDLDIALSWLKSAEVSGCKNASLALNEIANNRCHSTYSKNIVERMCLWFRKHKVGGCEAASFVLVLLYAFVVMKISALIECGGSIAGFLGSSRAPIPFFNSIPGFVSLVALPHLMACVGLNSKRQAGLKIVLWNVLFIQSSVIIRLFLYWDLGDDIFWLGVCWGLFLYELFCMGRIIHETVKIRCI